MFRGKIISDSMSPVLKVGQEVEIVPVLDFSQLKRFDIIVFKLGQDICAHFIWTKQNDLRTGNEVLITRSLKNPNNNDYPLYSDKIVGKILNHSIPQYWRIIIWIKICLGVFLGFK